MGHSAGGNLAISVCIKNGETGEIHPVALIAEYTPMDLATNPAEKPRAEGDMPAEVAKAYNEFYIDPETAASPCASPIFAQPEQLATFPNTLIISASKDSLCYEDEEFAINLARAGVSVTCKRFQNTPHGFTINRNGEWQASQAMIKNFIAHHF
jgi:acetyl esterase